MKHNEMTFSELLAWKSGDFDEYKKLIYRLHWLRSHIRGASERQLEAEDGMSVFRDDQHDDHVYLKYKERYKKETAKLEKMMTEYSEIENKLIPFMSRRR